MQSVRTTLQSELDEPKRKATHYQTLSTSDQLSDQQKRLAAIQERIGDLRQKLDGDKP